MSDFSFFLGIDWSGATGDRHSSIAVACATVGDDAPKLIWPKDGLWSRQGVLDWLLDYFDRNPETLVGFDFSFAGPWIDQGCYFPGLDSCPRDASALWNMVETICCGESDLGATGLIDRLDDYFYSGAARCGRLFTPRYRRCEEIFNSSGHGLTASIFKTIGAAQVGKASFSGMRLLHRLKRERGDIAIWPMESPSPGKPCVVEIYCRQFVALASGQARKKIRDIKSLNSVLKQLGSKPVRGRIPAKRFVDCADAMIAACGLRAIHGDGRFWSPAALSPVIASTEGWTMGVL